jgi:hypothetical protein
MERVQWVFHRVRSNQLHVAFLGLLAVLFPDTVCLLLVLQINSFYFENSICGIEFAFRDDERLKDVTVSVIFTIFFESDERWVPVEDDSKSCTMSARVAISRSRGQQNLLRTISLLL